MSSYEFRMWGIRKRDRQKPYQVRWLVAGRSHAETFVTRALAESFRAELMSAAARYEAEVLARHPQAEGIKAVLRDIIARPGPTRHARGGEGA